MVTFDAAGSAHVAGYRDKLLAAGLEERRVAALVDLVRPAIALDPAPSDDEAHPLGSTKVGGRPDLPGHVEWPRSQGVPLTFVAQFDLSDFAGLEAATPLPRSGLLSFFFEATWAIAGTTPRWGWDVLTVGSGASLERLAFPDDLDDYGRCAAASVSPRTEPTFVPWESPEFRALGFTSEEFGMYTAAMRALAQEAADARADWSEDDVRWLTFQLLGHPQDANLDILLESQYVANGLSLRDERYDERLHDQFEVAAREWRLLFQADSWDEIGMDWFGFGRLFFSIRDDDLRARRFHRATASSTR